MLYDTHAHLNDPRFEQDLDQVIARALENQVARINVVAWDMASSHKAIELAERYPQLIRAVVGVHPVNAKDFGPAHLKQLRQMVKHPLVVAVGEIGMDFHWDTTTVQQQERAFRQQMELAQEAGLPVVLHVRKAQQEVWNLLQEHGFPTGVMHAFSGSKTHAIDAVEKGYVLSVAGILVLGSKKLKKAVLAVGPEHLVIETDCPYMSPVRGQRNEPSMLRLILNKLARVLQLEPDHLETRLWENSTRVFQRADSSLK